MNYEELYGSLQNLEKDLKDKQAAAQKQYKNAVKSTEIGDIKSLYKNLETLAELISEQTGLVEKLWQKVEGFDTKVYFESGDFAGQLLESAKKRKSMYRVSILSTRCSLIR